MVIGGHFGGGDHFDGGDHFGGGTYPRAVCRRCPFMDGPLENLSGGGGGRGTKKYLRKGKLNLKKFMRAN